MPLACWKLHYTYVSFQAELHLLLACACPGLLVQGDGRYLISNGKDQTVKLWDLRGMRSHAEAQQLRRDRVPHFSWDYRCAAARLV